MGFSYGYAADKQDAISLIRTAVERVLHSSLLLKDPVTNESVT